MIDKYGVINLDFENDDDYEVLIKEIDINSALDKGILWYVNHMLLPHRMMLCIVSVNEEKAVYKLIKILDEKLYNKALDDNAAMRSEALLHFDRFMKQEEEDEIQKNS